MGLKKVDELSEQEISALDENQIKILEEKGEIELGTPDTPPPGETGGADAQSVKKETLPPSGEETVEEWKKKYKEEKNAREELERAKTGLLNEVVDLRRVRRETKGEEKPVPKDPLESLGDDDFLDGKTFKDTVRAILFQQQNQQLMLQQQRQIEELNRRVGESAAKAKENHPDYDEVVNKGFPLYLSQLNPSQRMFEGQKAIADNDPAEYLYKHSKTALTAQQNQGLEKTASEIKESLINKAKVLSGGGGKTAGNVSPEDVLKFSDKDMQDPKNQKALDDFLQKEGG